ncbi:phenylalanine--tRNA ligase subunit alpha [Anatilimnocola floriformis]|uniref:phenylalanine--tRNA ligase subunit alpha n=1 Tax=Anatilimnocola floriformis TaxID=2948575 RepID=UPI0020C40299|nr:phenylalanine--tRNA ligase subunit alpha [Anatilimnocola floriformis]
MALAEYLTELETLLTDAQSAFAAAKSPEALEAARIEFLGAKSGRLKSAQKGLGQVTGPDKPGAGKRFNEVKQAIEAAFTEIQQKQEAGEIVDPTAARFDITLPGIRPRVGRIHPISQTIDELKDIMGRLGFSIADGPEIEDEWHNFEALNIPLEHPARNPLDNFYLQVAQTTAPHTATTNPTSPCGQLLLRSQTSTVQIRTMETVKPPVRVISLGRVYRPDEADATHFPMFHQMEGLLIDKDVTLADLKSVLRMFATTYLGRDVHVRFRPSFFPFTEPSVEVDMSWGDKWMEFGGAGMVDPNVLRAVGYDPEEVCGFAFGLGIERLCMRRHGIDDIRYLYQNDVRFLGQF